MFSISVYSDATLVLEFEDRKQVRITKLRSGSVLVAETCRERKDTHTHTHRHTHTHTECEREKGGKRERLLSSFMAQYFITKSTNWWNYYILVLNLICFMS